jgi:hypothetical protein
VHDVAHVTVVDDHGMARVVHDGHRRTPPGREQLGIHARQADRLELMGAERRQHVGVERARIDHLGHVERRVVGHSPPRHDHGLHAQPARERSGLRPAAVHDDDADAEGVEQRDLRGDAVEGVVVLDDLTPQLHDEHVVAVGANVAQGAFEAGNALVGIYHCSRSLYWLLAASR